MPVLYENNNNFSEENLDIPLDIMNENLPLMTSNEQNFTQSKKLGTNTKIIIVFYAIILPIIIIFVVFSGSIISIDLAKKEINICLNESKNSLLPYFYQKEGSKCDKNYFNIDNSTCQYQNYYGEISQEFLTKFNTTYLKINSTCWLWAPNYNFWTSKGLEFGSPNFFYVSFSSLFLLYLINIIVFFTLLFRNFKQILPAYFIFILLQFITICLTIQEILTNSGWYNNDYIYFSNNQEIWNEIASYQPKNDFLKPMPLFVIINIANMLSIMSSLH